MRFEWTKCDAVEQFKCTLVKLGLRVREHAFDNMLTRRINASLAHKCVLDHALSRLGMMNSQVGMAQMGQRFLIAQQHVILRIQP